MNKKLFQFNLLVTIFLITSFTSQVLSGGEIDTTEPMIPYADFSNSDVTLDGMPSEPGLEQITIDLTSGAEMIVSWRHNSDTLHVVLSSTYTGWLGVGWFNSVPQSTTGRSVMVDANMVVGYDNNGMYIEDGTGSRDGPDIDETNNTVDYFVDKASPGAILEFLFPLASTDPVDQPLSEKAFGYFIFASSDSPTLASGHLSREQAIYIEKVYIESSAKEGYQSSPNADFGSFSFIILPLLILTSFKFMKRLKESN